MPGYQCSDNTCDGRCHPACLICTGTQRFLTPNDYLSCIKCSPLSQNYDLVTQNPPIDCGDSILIILNIS